MKRLILAAIMVCSSVLAMAQTDDFYFDRSNFWSLGIETRMSTAITDFIDDEYGSIDLEAQIGYHIDDDWSIHIPLTLSNNIFYETHTFVEQVYLGISAEYRAFETSDYSMFIVPKIQSTLGGRWGAMSYDLGFKFEWRKNPYVTCGFRYIDTYKSVIKSKPCIYFSFGCRFGFK